MRIIDACEQLIDDDDHQHRQIEAQDQRRAHLLIRCEAGGRNAHDRECGDHAEGDENTGNQDREIEHRADRPPGKGGIGLPVFRKHRDEGDP